MKRARTEATTATAHNAEPVNTEPVNTEPVNAEPVNAEPVNAEPVNLFSRLRFNSRAKQVTATSDAKMSVELLLKQMHERKILASNAPLTSLVLPTVESANRNKFKNTLELIGQVWTEQQRVFLRSSPTNDPQEKEKVATVAKTIQNAALQHMKERDGKMRGQPFFTGLGERYRKWKLKQQPQPSLFQRVATALSPGRRGKH